MESQGSGGSEFTERDFYLAEFRGRTLAIALRSGCGEGPGGAQSLRSLSEVVAELVSNSTRVVVLSPDRTLLAKVLGRTPIELSRSDGVSQLWKTIKEHGKAGLVLPGLGGFAVACHRASQRLGFSKLVWVDDPPVLGAWDDGPGSYVDREGLDRILGAGGLSADCLALLGEIHAMIDEGLPAVNVCSLDGLREELFTYAGSGTLFTREGYTVVRDLALHEFDAAHHLMARGVAEGFLLERSAAQQEHVLAHAFGVFVENRYLAGIGALLPHPGDPSMGEVVSLYTVTRFVGEGVGGHLIDFAMDRARTTGLAAIFACTTSLPVEKFFRRHGFSVVESGAVSASKWRGYPLSRRAAVRCLTRPIDGDSVAGGGL